MTPPPILVTGANGLVGGACVAALSAAGRDVLAVSRQGSGGGPAIDLSLPFEQGLGTLDLSRGALGVIVHLAAAVPHDARYPDSPASAELTRAIDRHVDRAADAWGSRVVYISTCSLYDPRDGAPKTPRSPLAPSLTHYAAAKLDGERRFAAKGAVIFRLSAPVGPAMRPQLVFRRFAEACRDGKAIELWGTGAREQDFIDLDDVCDLILSAVTSDRDGLYNCASGRAVTMVALAEAMVRFYRRGEIVWAGRDDPLDGDTARYDIADTMRTFDWAPRRDLAATLERFEAGATGRRHAAPQEEGIPVR